MFFISSLVSIFAAGGYLFSSGDELTNEVPQSTVSGTTAPSDKEHTNNIDNSTPDASAPDKKYLTSLKSALYYTDIEGLIKDRASTSLESRVEYYKRLAGVIGGFDGESDKISASGVYNGESFEIKLAKSGLYDEYTSGVEKVTVYTKVHSPDDGSYVTHSSDIVRARCKVVPYMGYLLVGGTDENGNAFISLCSYDGEVLVDNIEDKEPYFARDYDNLPVFVDSQSQYYSFDGKKFNKIKRENVRAELYYDYPASPLAAYNGSTEVKYLPRYDKYQFVNYKSGKASISARYLYAFNFSQGYAVVMTTANAVRIINTSAKSMFASTAWHIFPGTRMYVQYFFALPDTLGIESMGFSGFDNGWLRVRVRALSRMNNSYNTVADDVDKLINTNGEYFDIPDGYTLEGYSNGVLLLSKDGLYGYYSINGYWIAQPIYDYARPFIQGLAVVGYADGTVGMIDTEGNIVLPFVYTHISDVSSGVITAYTEGIGWNVYCLCEK